MSPAGIPDGRTGGRQCRTRRVAALQADRQRDLRPRGGTRGSRGVSSPHRSKRRIGEGGERERRRAQSPTGMRPPRTPPPLESERLRARESHSASCSMEVAHHSCGALPDLQQSAKTSFEQPIWHGHLFIFMTSTNIMNRSVDASVSISALEKNVVLQTPHRITAC